ncbi:uncharacterized protein N7477_007920 [Penicillium maclennaniae]|uniref:uncharacterized protein n=1 Tax=Penicillium maclennaniae TaxID=1343394 RepID=UPI00254184A6|nr:uncharacterized protein N7477_007920 [Penicillium maclennaniae]KAJ5665472.1 hypothetical protein N7477_007920 [Penicillium maclennaniae]
MLLGMYEVITCHACGTDLMDRWANHINGAMRLMELRGPKQLETPAGLELFSQIRIQIAISNIFYRRYSSPVMVQLSNMARSYRDSKSQVIDNFYNILTRIGDLSAMISDSIPNSPSSNPVLFIQNALHLDADLVAWAMSIDPTWHYTVIKASPASINDDNQIYHTIYGDTYHKYNTLGFASLWNTYRLLRIMLRRIIGSTCKSMLRRGECPEKRLTMAQGVVIIKQMAEDVCASVPYYFTSDDVAIGGLMQLIWPLFVASDCVESEPKMKKWILQTLDKIGYTTGIQQALMMSKLARAGNSYSVTQELYKEDKMRQSTEPYGDEELNSST